MATRNWTSRPLRHLAGPTLLAVMAILAGSSGMSHAATAPGLAVVAVASLAAFSEDVSTLVYGPGQERLDSRVAIGPPMVMDGSVQLDRLGLFHLVLPPPAS